MTTQERDIYYKIVTEYKKIKEELRCIKCNGGSGESGIPMSEKGAANGVAPLNAQTKIDAIYLPSYVDDVLEFANLAAMPNPGETGKIYIALDTNFTYRWSGSAYVEISPSNPNTILQGGNSFGTVMHIGTNDNNSVRVRVNNTGVASFGSSGQLITAGNIATNGSVTDAAPPYSVTIPSSGNGIAAYNTTDQTTNYERVRQYWGANEYYIRMERGGTGNLRSLRYQDFNSVIYAGTGVVFGNSYQSSGATNLTLFNNGLTATTSTTQNQTTIAPAINQSGSAGYRALWVSPYEQATGSGSKFLIDAGTNSSANGGGTHTSVFNVDNTGLTTATQYKISALNTAPASATDTGTLGEIRITATHIYICTATNTWVRAALTTW